MKKLSKLLGVLGIISSIVLFNSCVKAAAYREYTIGQEIKFDPIAGEYCTSGDNCKTFNVINVGENSRYYEMMLNYNLIPTSTWGDTVNGPTVAVSELKEATKNWKGIEAYYNSVQLPSSSGTYTINYNGSKARMITAEEVAAMHNYETIGGNPWVWNETENSNNLQAKNNNLWLGKNLGTATYNNPQYNNVYDGMEVESGHFPFNYYTSSSCGISGKVYIVNYMAPMLSCETLNFDYGNFDVGLRPVVKLKKQVDNSVNDSTLVNPIVISGTEVIPGNKIPTIDELSVTGGLKIENIIWAVKKDDINYQDVIAEGLETFEEGKSYALILYFDGTKPENYRYYLPINDYVYKYNDVENEFNSHSGDGYTEVVFLFDNIKEKEIDNETIMTTKVNKEKNPDTLDKTMINTIMLISGMIIFVFGTRRVIKKSR